MKQADILPSPKQFLIILASLALVVLLGLANYLLTWEISFAIFYLLPIFLCVHNVGRMSGIIVSLAAGATWFTVEAVSAPHYSHPIFGYWNGTALLGVFLIFTLLMASVEESLKREKSINKTLESLLTLAPSDQQGWLATGEGLAGESKRDPYSTIPPPPDGPLPFETAVPPAEAGNGQPGGA